MPCLSIEARRPDSPGAHQARCSPSKLELIYRLGATRSSALFWLAYFLISRLCPLGQRRLHANVGKLVDTTDRDDVGKHESIMIMNPWRWVSPLRVTGTTPECETPAWAGSTALIRKWHAKKAHRTRIECSSLHAPSLYFHALTIILASLHLHLLLPSSRD